MEKIDFDIENHIYRVNGRVIPNNTSILDDQGVSDISGIPEERLKYKSALGLAVHYCIHLHESGNLDEDSIDPRIAPYFSAYKKFCEVNRFEPRHTELMLYSAKWQFCTTIDLQGPLTLGGVESESLIEIKNVWAMQPSCAIQTAAQQIAFEENHDIKIKKRYGLQLKPSGNYELIPYTDPNDKQIFLAALTVYKWREQHGLVKKKDKQ